MLRLTGVQPELIDALDAASLLRLQQKL